jgi:hypothetical protein
VKEGGRLQSFGNSIEAAEKGAFVTFGRETLRKEEMTTILSKSENKETTSASHVRGVEFTAPSARIPVTLANRDYLRFLRQAELEAWRRARGGTICRN